MKPSSHRIVVQGTTPHQHEQRAVAAIIDALPDQDPFRLWCLFDLVDPSTGRRYEMDTLVLAPHGLYHVEIKGYPGTVRGDLVDWEVTWDDKRTSTVENPMSLAERKTRVLAGELRRLLRHEAPYVETLVYLSDAKNELKGAAAVRVIDRTSFKRALLYGDLPGIGLSSRPPIDNHRAAKTLEALAKLGLRKSAAPPRMGNYVLGRVLEDGPGYQDREARNERITEKLRRVRTYLLPEGSTKDRADQLRRAASREARMLAVVGDHPNILSVEDFEADGTDLPRLAFDHVEDEVTLDVFLRRHPALPFRSKLRILEQVADALAYCHRKKVLHRDLHPGAVLVRAPSDLGRSQARMDGRIDGRTDGTRDAKVDVRLFNFQLASGEGSAQGTVHISQVGGDRAIVYRAPELLEDPSKAGEAADVFSLGALAYFVTTGRHPGANLAERTELLARGKGRLSVAAIDDSLAGGARPASSASSTSVAGFGNGDPDVSTGARRLHSVDEVIGFGTDVDALQRCNSVADFIELLVAEARVDTPAAAPVADGADPLEARAHDILLVDGEEVLVEKVLGTGATARVLRVHADRGIFALKVSRDPKRDDDLRAEADALRKLRSERIVELHGTPVVGKRPCLLLRDAGETLGDVLARDGAQSIDYAQRWGDDLLLALRQLEEKDIRHRDIKPANLGVTSGAGKGKKSLFLFDFSLAGARPTDVDVGTPAYRDPMVLARGVWDAAADRYGAAVTLYEILTGARPVWSSGDAAVSARPDATMVVEAERFDPAVREPLLAFFQKAFARDAATRHDSAEAMRDQWLACFLAPVASSARPAGASAATEAAVALPAIDFAALTDTTPIQAVEGLSAEAKNALDRSGVIAVRDALALPANQLSAIRGVGRKTAKEVHAFVLGLRGRTSTLPATPATAATTATTPTASGAASETTKHATPLAPFAPFTPFAPSPFYGDFAGGSLTVRDLDLSAGAVVALESAGITTARDAAEASEERLARILVRVPDGVAKLRAALATAQRPRTVHAGVPENVEEWVQRLFPVGKKSHEYMRELFGIDEAPGGGYVATAAELAKRHGQTAPSIGIPLGKARDKWRTDPDLGTLIEPVLASIDAAGGVARIERLVDDLLQRFGHASPGGDASGAAADDVTRWVTRRGARALVRVVAEVQDDLARLRIEGDTWIARSQEHLTLARSLGHKADDLAKREPLPAFETARDALVKITEGTVLEALSAERLVELAAQVSRTAAASARLELYPRGMPAARALRLSAGALGSAEITPEQVRRTVALRYPAAEPLPEGDDGLARLVAELGLTLRDGVFVRPGSAGPSTTQTQLAATPDSTSRDATSRDAATIAATLAARAAEPSSAAGAIGTPIDPEVVDRKVFEKQLLTAARNRSFRVLLVNAAQADTAAHWLSKLLGTPAISLERDVLDALDALETELEIDRDIIVETDRKGPAAGDDWARLCDLVGEAATRVVTPLVQKPGTLLLTQPGLFARYRLEAPLHALREATQRDDGPGVFLIVPSYEDGPRVIDAPTGALPIPLSSPAQCVKIHEKWLSASPESPA